MGQFSSFVILGAMRTGSNFLESSLNEAEGLTSYGEVFNPAFIGKVKAEEFFGYTKEMRDADPLSLLERMREDAEGLPGFRFFQDHDPRVLDAVLADPACAKIVLSRNPLHSFISLCIAQETGQWMLLNEKRRREAKVMFDPQAFESYLKSHMSFYFDIRKTLQEAGQTAFWVDYDELTEIGVLNGLLAWLGVPGQLKAPSKRVKKQNVINILDRVKNPNDIHSALTRIEFLDPRIRQYADRIDQFHVRSIIAAADAPVLYLPISSNHADRIEGWMAALDETDPSNLLRNLNPGGVRFWCQANPEFRAFTVISHPVERAHYIFEQIIDGSSDLMKKLHSQLGHVHKLDLPESLAVKNAMSDNDLRAAFLRFLNFLTLSIEGRTSIRVHPFWATQAAMLEAICTFRVPDVVVRASDLEQLLQMIATQIGYNPVDVPAPFSAGISTLAAIYNADVEAAVRKAYERDYITFNFENWAS